ncbi:hypothetical protein MKX68_21690 [Paenibacillus sp. FSL M8-0212]
MDGLLNEGDEPMAGLCATYAMHGVRTGEACYVSLCTNLSK